MSPAIPVGLKDSVIYVYPGNYLIYFIMLIDSCFTILESLCNKVLLSLYFSQRQFLVGNFSEWVEWIQYGRLLLKDTKIRSRYNICYIMFYFSFFFSHVCDTWQAETGESVLKSCDAGINNDTIGSTSSINGDSFSMANPLSQTKHRERPQTSSTSESQSALRILYLKRLELVLASWLNSSFSLLPTSFFSMHIS